MAPHAIRRAALQNLVVVLPATALAVALAPWGLAVFGADYALHARSVFVVLAASTVVVAPGYLYLGLLRAREHPVALVVLPLAVIATLLVLVPPFEARWGLAGVGYAWLAANAPFGAWSAWRLALAAKEVSLPAPAPVGRRADAE